MSPSTPSPWLRFLDSFLQEKNIKWVLVTGLLILFGSSLLLVTSHWDDCTPLWKYVILLGYTVAIAVSGPWCYRWLGLRKTGTGLMALAVLLLPITFLALHWVPGSSPFDHGIRLSLLLGNLAFSQWAARRILHHLLRGSQPTFVASYLLLCLAGALAPGVPAPWSGPAAVVLWLIFTAGVVKVNRHVFWLTEMGLAPRIFGFFPIGLLGLQFLVLFAVFFAPHVPLDWLGLGCVLIAAPVLLTADAVARVFQQRTGDLVRPLPWSIVVPLGVGILLCVSGLCLAGTGIASRQPHALVPTAAVAAGLLAVLAQRTQHRAFTWAMLGCVLLAYNFSPVFFREFARLLIQQGAQAVREDRLPYAFYGLTYLPVIVLSMLASRLLERARAAVFAGPVQAFSIGLSCLLLGASLGHAKAVFPVAAVMTGVFTLQALLFDDRRLVAGALAGWFMAALGFPVFAEQFLGWSLAESPQLFCLAVAAIPLLMPGCLFDRAMHLRQEGLGWLERCPCQSTSLVMALEVACLWIGQNLGGTEVAAWSGALAALLLVIHSVRWARPDLGVIAVVIANVVALVLGRAHGAAAAQLISQLLMELFGLWVCSYLLERHPQARLSQTFAWPFYSLSYLGLLIVTMLYLPIFANEMGFPWTPGWLLGLAAPLLDLDWPFRLLALAWAFDGARRRGHADLSLLGCLGLLGLVGSTFIGGTGADGHAWLPALWTGTALIGLPLVHRLQVRAANTDDTDLRRRLLAVTQPAHGCLWVIFTCAAAGSLLSFLWPMRVAGALAATGLLILAALAQQPLLRTLAMIIINWQGLCLIVLIVCPSLRTLLDIGQSDLAVCVPLAFATALSLHSWQSGRRHATPLQETVARWHCAVLRILIGTVLVLSLQLGGLAALDALMAALAFGLFALSEFRAALRQQAVERVWLGLALLAAGVGYFAALGMVTLESGACMFIALAVGLSLWITGQWTANRPAWMILAQPFRQLGLVMPLVAVAVGVFRHFVAVRPDWLGLNSLALLLAAGFYFWHGLEQRRRDTGLLAGAILNVALILLWRELDWSDPQFYMIPLGISILALVEVLREEFPPTLHDPLRYLGALVILVSPTFHIVGGSWLHLFTLMAASVAIVLLAIGLRVRALIYTGTAFLVADLIAMLVRESIDHPSMLWLAGLGLGSAVVALAAACENHRELLLERVRRLGFVLQTWD